MAAKDFYINVGLFANPDNAHNARRKLLKASLPAATLDMETTKGKRTRVRVGPFQSRSETKAAMVKIRALQLDAVAVQP